LGSVSVDDARVFFRGGDACHYSFQKNPKELTVYTWRKKRGKDIAVAEICLSLLLTNLWQTIYLVAGLILLTPTSSYDNLGEGAIGYIIIFWSSVKRWLLR